MRALGNWLATSLAIESILIKKGLYQNKTNLPGKTSSAQPSKTGKQHFSWGQMKHLSGRATTGQQEKISPSSKLNRLGTVLGECWFSWMNVHVCTTLCSPLQGAIASTNLQPLLGRSLGPERWRTQGGTHYEWHQVFLAVLSPDNHCHVHILTLWPPYTF